MRHWLAGLMLALGTAVQGQAQAVDLAGIVDGHILPGYAALSDAAEALSAAAAADCDPASPNLRAAFGTAFDAWITVSHLRFGPSEVDDRAFALAFWPDTRGFTPKTLSGLIAEQDPSVDTLDAFQEVSVAARGFYALEFLLYDANFISLETATYRCKFIQIVSADIADVSRAIEGGWDAEDAGYGALIVHAGSNDTYRTEEEAIRQLYTALTTGLQFTSDVRLGRPLGTFDRPRPTRAEARRSGRSLRHVVLSLTSLRDLAARLSGDDATLDAAFATALDVAADLDDPVFAGVDDPTGRLRVEILQQRIDAIRLLVGSELGPKLGIAAGFNALDGD